MSKIYVTNNTGSLQTLNNADDDKVKVYNSLEDVDTSVLEEGEIIAVKDQAIDISDIADTIVDNATAEIDNLIANSGVPAGTIASIKSNATLNGWLPCDGSTFDRTEYPFLYAALGNSNVLPIVYESDNVTYKYIRALSGVETAEESQSVVNAIAQAETSLETLVESEIGDYAKDAVSDAVSDWVDVTSDFTFENITAWNNSTILIYWNKSLKQLRVYTTRNESSASSNDHRYKLTYNGSDTDIDFTSPTLFVTQSMSNSNRSAGYEPNYHVVSSTVIELGAYNRNSSSNWPTGTMQSAKIEF